MRIALLAVAACFTVAAAADPYGGLPVGIQSYSVRNLKTFDEAVQAISGDLGLRWVEFYPGHLRTDIAGEPLAAAKRQLEQAGLKVSAIGVVRFGKDAAANEQLFQLAKELGMKSISCDPDPAAFASMDELCEKHGIATAIHNHGPGHRYGSIEQMQKAIEGRHRLFGICLDTGHTIRSGEDPVQALTVFKDRLYGVHLKDFKPAGGGKFTDVPLGQGQLDVDAAVAALLAMRYQGSLSIEYEGADPIGSVKASLERLRAAVAKAQAASAK